MPFVPDRIPSNIATPSFSLDTPKSAFGGAMAEAMSSFGADLTKSGNELFARAQAMQELQNRSAANDAETDYVLKSGDALESHRSSQGKNAVEGYKGFQEGQVTAREEGGKDLNPAAKRMYDQSTKSIMARTILEGARHSAAQNKHWINDSSNASIAASKDRAGLTPEDDVAFQAEIAKTTDNINAKASAQGWDTVERDQELAEAKSALWENRVKSLADRKPETARKMLSDAVSSGGLRGEKIARTTTYVNERLYSVGSRHISEELASGEQLGSAKVGIQQARGAISVRESGSWGGNYGLLGPEVIRKDGTSRGRALGRYQVMPENLPEWLEKAGQPQMSPAEFLKNPKVQDAVFDKIFGDSMEKHGTFNDAASVWFTGRPVAQAVAAGANDQHTSIQTYLRDTNRALAAHGSLSSKEEMGRKRAMEIAPDDPIFADRVVERIQTDYTKGQKTKRDDELDQSQTITAGILGLKTDKGKLPTTVEELRGISPEIAVAYDNLAVTNPTKANQFVNFLAKNAKGDRALTREGLARWQELKGMAHSDPKGFLEQNILEENLPIATQKELASLQFKMKERAEADPRVTHALQVLRPMISGAGFDRSLDKPGYDQFVGALQDQLTDYQTMYQKPPDAAAIEKMGARLLQQRHSPEYMMPWSKDYMFKQPVPSKEQERIKNLPAWSQLGIVPTDDQIQRIYTREQYQTLYGGTAKTEADPKGPQVPISR